MERKENEMKTITLIICLALCLPFIMVGCKAMDEQAVEGFSNDVQLLSLRIDDYQKEVVKIAEMLEADDLISSKVVVRLDKINEERDRVQPQIDRMVEAGKNIESEDPWEIARVINTTSAPWNPYAPPIAAGLLLAEAITVMFLKKKSDESKANATLYAKEFGKRVADKVGREKTLRELAAMDEKDVTASVVENMMYKNIGDERRGNGVA